LGGGGGDKGRVDRLLLSGRKGEYKKESTVKVRRKAPENTGKAEAGEVHFYPRTLFPELFCAAYV